MIKFLSDVDPLVLDVAVCSMLVLIVFFGALRSFKKTFVNFLILAASLFLGFSSYVSSVKSVLIEKVLLFENLLPAGTGSVEVFMCSLMGSFIASLIFSLLIYLVMRAVFYLFKIILKRKSANVHKKKTVVGRVFGGVVSLAYGGAILITLLFMFNSNIIGMKAPVRQSVVTRFLVEKTESLVNKIQPDLSEKIVLKVYKGDFMAQISGDLIEAYDYIDKEAMDRLKNEEYIANIENVAFTKEETESMMKNYVLDLYHISLISADFDDSNIVLKDKYIDMANGFIAIMNKSVNNNLLGNLGFSVEENGLMRNALKRAGVDDSGLNLFNEIIEGVTN